MQQDIIKIQDQFYIRAKSALTDHRTRVLKKDELFAVFDVFGDIQPYGQGSQGLFWGSTRFLSYYELRINGAKPLLLSSTVRNDNALCIADLTNSDITDLENSSDFTRGLIHIFREKFLVSNSCYEKIRIKNFHTSTVNLEISLDFDSDFADIFEVRGVLRKAHGTTLPVEISSEGVCIKYFGLDNVMREFILEFSVPTPYLLERRLSYRLALNPNEEKTFTFKFKCNSGDLVLKSEDLSYEVARLQNQHSVTKSRDRQCEVLSSDKAFNNWLHRSMSDLEMLTTSLESGPYPYAGIPWFCTIFGRDGLITALQTLWFNPDIAKGVLLNLARTQSLENNPHFDAEIGKILHEARFGEMVALKEVPFQHYYGSVDSTPLFVILAGRYLKTTGDFETVKSIWPSIEKALEWIEKDADCDGDGFIEYIKKSEKGLENQAWKDSSDSVSHSDGELAQAPIASVEVQAYVYEAKLQASFVAQSLGFSSLSTQLNAEALALFEKFNDVFWVPQMGFYALALDKHKKACEVKSSNVAHALFTGVVCAQKALSVVENLMNEDMFSGWGLRTLSSNEKRFNPMSYHNGSVWPHDVAIAAEGMSRYGFKNESLVLFKAMYEACINFDLYRLPELFCGFTRRYEEMPTLYPVACLPQAWASGALFMFIKAALGMEIDGFRERIYFKNPMLPDFLKELTLKQLKVGNKTVDLHFVRSSHGVTVNILSQSNQVEIILMARDNNQNDFNSRALNT
jgi:glycogen debranching enzyme